MFSTQTIHPPMTMMLFQTRKNGNQKAEGATYSTDGTSLELGGGENYSCPK